MLLLTVIGLFVIFVLACIAGYYLYLLQKQKKAQRLKIEMLQKQAEKRHKENITSILILSRALLQDEVTLTEASIRINSIASVLDLPSDSIDKLSVFKQLAEATVHIPILDQWKKLSRSDKKRFEKERLGIEGKYADFVKASARQILERPEILSTSKPGTT